MASEPSTLPELTTLLQELCRAGVDFVLVGGLAAVAQGAPVTTFDVDVVHSRSPENIARLVAFLERIKATYRGQPPSSPLGPSAEALATTGHSLFNTDLGPLDALGAIEGGRQYEDLLSESINLEIGGVRVRVLRLEALVAMKRGSRDPKDLLRLPVLEETLARTFDEER